MPCWCALDASCVATADEAEGAAMHERGVAISGTEADKVAATLSKDEKPSTTPPMPEATGTANISAPLQNTTDELAESAWPIEPRPTTTSASSTAPGSALGSSCLTHSVFDPHDDDHTESHFDEGHRHDSISIVNEVTESYVTLPPPPVAALLDQGIVFREDILYPLDRLPMPITITNGAQFLWGNRAFASIYGISLGSVLDQEELRARMSANAQHMSEMMRKRMASNRRKIQELLTIIDTPMTHYPDCRPPISFRVLGIPINMQLTLGDESIKGVVQLRIFAEPSPSNEEDQRARQGFLSTSAMVSILNADGKAILQNPSALEWWGSPAVASVSKFNDENKLRALFGKKLDQTLATVSRFGITKTRFEVVPGTWHMITAAGAKDPVTGELIIVLNQDDVTAIQELENAKKNVEMTRKIVERKDMLFANVSHELKTPLNGIIGLSSALLDRAGDEEQLKLLTSIHSSAHRLAALVGNLVDSAASKKGRLTVMQHAVDLRLLASEVIELCQSLVQHGVQLLRIIPDDLPHILGDHDRITQVLMNLVGNALKAVSSLSPLASVALACDCSDCFGRFLLWLRVHFFCCSSHALDQCGLRRNQRLMASMC
jgi:signal transduction histidine kinase